MCGLLAYVGSEVPRSSLEAAHRFQAKRGLDRKDYQRSVYTNQFFIGHNTLPLVSNSDFHQPKHKDGGQMFAFTGEIFNYADFGAKTDIELFKPKLNLEQIHQFDGFWAYAQVDKDNLFAMTDFLSIKPIYYRTDINAVASEPKTLTFLGDTSEDKVFLSNVKKWGYSPDNRTQWEQIKQLPPGHIYLDGEISPYWDWSKIKVEENLIDLLKESVNRRTQGIGKIAMLLSGGLDSSLIYSLITDKSKVKTFHVENNEYDYAKLMDPYVKEISLSSISRELAMELHQSPVDLGSVLPQAAMAKTMNEKGFNVVITGDGADELFGGYRRAKEYDSQGSDVFVELPYYHLPRLDRINMAFTIECRSPYLSPKIIKYAMGLSYESRTNKQELKRIAKNLVHDAIINRQKVPLRAK